MEKCRCWPHVAGQQRLGNPACDKDFISDRLSIQRTRNDRIKPTNPAGLVQMTYRPSPWRKVVGILGIELVPMRTMICFTQVIESTLPFVPTFRLNTPIRLSRYQRRVFKTLACTSAAQDLGLRC